MAFDFGTANLSRLADEPQEMELVHFDSKEPLGVFLTVRGYESATFKELARKETNAQRRREFEAARKGKNATVRLLEDDEEAGVRLTASLIVGWRTEVNGKSEPVIFKGGEKIECTPDAVAAFLDEFSWVIPQINEFAGEIANFTGASSKSSPPSRGTGSASA